MNCWPSITNGQGMACMCGNWEIKFSQTPFAGAQYLWRRHFIRELERESDRPHQDRT